ncbi:hypothetical protein RUM43_012217 [Polyplax serrata]|uniref:Uncharacterized protein n=1 Tax=Polyplax serrata TaxID=468196 RepID=A0AAN8NKB1_POLSC
MNNYTPNKVDQQINYYVINQVETNLFEGFSLIRKEKRAHAVSVLKNSRTLDLVLKKGSGIDLFPGESSGYSSSSSVADEAVGQSPPKSKRLSMVAEEGDDRGQRKSCHCKSLRNKLKSSGSIDSIFDNISNEGSTYREKSKSIEILTTDLNDRKTLTYRNGDHISRTLLNFKSGPETGRPAGGGDGGGCVGVTSGGRQTVIKINGKELGVPGKCPTMPPEKKLTEGLVSVEVHRSNNEDDGSNGSPGQKCSSSSSSLSSAISQEIQKRNERRLKGITNMTPIPDKNNNNSSSTNNGGGSDKQPKGELMKSGNRQQRHQHDLLIAELKKKQGWEEKPSMQIQVRFP